jgi:hypothetical protein
VYVRGGTYEWYEEECLARPEDFIGKNPLDLDGRFFAGGDWRSHALYLPPDKTSPSDEPQVPFKVPPWPLFRAHAPFNLVCLARSPAFTPPTADSVFNAIRDRYIDERLPYPPGEPPWT